MNALALQCGPQQWVLYAIIGLLQVYKSCKQGLLLRFGPVNEMAQGEQVVLCGEPWTKASLAGRTQAVGLGPIDNAAVEDGCVQSAEWFPDCYGAIITGVRLISLLKTGVMREDLTAAGSVPLWNALLSRAARTGASTYSLLTLPSFIVTSL